MGRSANTASSQFVSPGRTPAQHGNLQKLFFVKEMKSKKLLSSARVGKGVQEGSGARAMVDGTVGVSVDVG